jgi:hypothetical protein
MDAAELSKSEGSWNLADGGPSAATLLFGVIGAAATAALAVRWQQRCHECSLALVIALPPRFSAATSESSPGIHAMGSCRVSSDVPTETRAFPRREQSPNPWVPPPGQPHGICCIADGGARRTALSAGPVPAALAPVSECHARDFLGCLAQPIPILAIRQLATAFTLDSDSGTRVAGACRVRTATCDDGISAGARRRERHSSPSEPCRIGGQRPWASLTGHFCHGSDFEASDGISQYQL